MSWVRIDDGFTNHPKIVQLSDSEFRVWLRLLCYCARVQDPTVDVPTRREVAGLTPKRIDHLTELGLLDRRKGGHEIHDWATYRKKDETNAERQARWRGRKSGVTNGVTPDVTAGVTSLAGDQARAPVPEPVPENPKAVNEASYEEDNGLVGFEIDKSLEKALRR